MQGMYALIRGHVRACVPSLLSAMGGHKERSSVCNLEESSPQNQTVSPQPRQPPER